MPKTLVAALLAAVVALPATAQPTPSNDPIEVRGTAQSQAAWTSAMARSIDDNLRYPYKVGAPRTPTGVVKMAFHHGADGRASDVTVIQSSNSDALDKSAVTALQQAAAANPMPARQSARPVQAWVYFADTQFEERQLTRQLKREAALVTQTASAEDGPVLIVAGQ